MNGREKTNIPASVHQRLLNKAREEGRPFNELLQFHAMERFLYRLSESEFKEGFVLKGAVLLRVWVGGTSRPTRDIDLLGTTSNQVEGMVEVMQAICTQSVEPDGMVFDSSFVEGARIVEGAQYKGVRVKFRGSLGKAIVPMQVDIGFGDVVSPSPRDIDYPSILGFPAPRLRGYTKESVMAEKFEAMIRLGILNSRMKDFYDAWMLSMQFPFDGAALSAALEKTLARRGTELPKVPVALSPEFAMSPEKQAQWLAFRRTSRLDDAPADFSDLTRDLARFLFPVAERLTDGRPFEGSWDPQGPWYRRPDQGERE